MGACEKRSQGDEAATNGRRVLTFKLAEKAVIVALQLALSTN